VALGVLFCPCHIAIVLFLLGGTVIGAFLANNFLLTLLAAGGAFVFCLALGLWLLRSVKTPGTRCVSADCARPASGHKPEIVSGPAPFSGGALTQPGESIGKDGYREAI
jgi:hypothetical protein